MIAEFFEDAEIFITGGSGVVGKAFIEKLLRSCNVRRVYLLIRPKKNRSIEERLAAMRKEKIFTRLVAEKPDCFDKIVGIPGDVMYPKLGISAEDLERMKNVTLFYHSAATVRFDENIKLAMNLNVGGTHEALLLAESMKKLKMFMHVSTFFSNPYLEYVEPKVYPAPVDWRFALERLKEEVDESILDILSKKITVGFPNTYCFTKNLAESLVNDFRHRVPVTIVRPSIVIHALSEPEPGFPSSLTGAIGLFALAACGLVKTVYARKGVELDMTPLDICSKSMFYYTVRARRLYDQVGIPDEAPVYIISSANALPLDFEGINKFIMDHRIWVNYAVEKNVLIPSCHLTESRFVYMAQVFLQQIPAALLGDFFLKLFNHPPFIMSLVRRCFVTLKVMDAFRLNHFYSDGITDFEDMAKEIRYTDFDVSQDYFRCQTPSGLLATIVDMSLGIRKHLLNENPDTIERSRLVVEGKIVFVNVVKILLAYFLIMRVYQRIFG